MNTWKKQALKPFFTDFFKSFQDMSPKRRSGHKSVTISTSLGIFVLGLGLKFTKKYNFTYSY